MYIHALVFLFTAYFASAHQITPCTVGDSACYISSVKQAIDLFAGGSAELGIESADPMKIALIESNRNGLELVFKDTTITGLKNCEVTEIKYDEAKNKQSVKLKCSLNLNGWYKLGGKLLVVPIEGEGKYNVKIEDMVIKATMNVETLKGADGKTHWHIIDSDHSYKVLTRSTFSFDNLFNGNDALSASVHDFANTNWKDVMTEVAPGIVDAIVKEVINRIELAYKGIPIDDVLKN